MEQQTVESTYDDHVGKDIYTEYEAYIHRM
jgi:hypothetical protein